jgi:HSP20 family protein
MRSLTRWTPFTRTVSWPFDFWGDGAIARIGSAVPLKLGVDVIQNPSNYTIEASLPGFDVNDIDVTVDDGVLRIAATHSSDETKEDGRYLVRERRNGKYYRALRIPDGIDIDAAKTGYKDGVLKIELPKNDVDQPKRLPIAA